MSGKEERPNHLSSQDLNVPLSEESLSREEALSSLKELMPTINPLELAAVTEMFKNLHGEGEMPKKPAGVPSLSLSLEIEAGKGVKSHLIPVTFKNLDSEMVVLEANKFEGISNPETLQGKIAILHLTDPESQESININAIMTWTQSTDDQKINLILKILNTQSPKPASKILENSLLAASKDTRRSWNLWDKTQETPESIDQRDNILLLMLACGTIGSGLLDPKTFQTMQYLLSVIGLGKIIRIIRGR